MHGSVIRHDGAEYARFLGIAFERFALLGYREMEWTTWDRRRKIAHARAAVAAHLRALTPRPSYPMIARLVGVADHTSVIHMVRAHARRAAAASTKIISTEILDPVIRKTA